MKKTLYVLFIIVITLSCCGCDVFVSGEDYRILQRDFETQIALNQTMKEEMRAVREELIVVRRELETAKRDLAALRRTAPLMPPIEDTGEPASSAAGDTPEGQPPILPPDETPAAASAGTSSTSSVLSSASSSGAAASSSSEASSVPSEPSSVSSTPPIDEKTQSKFKDIANALG